MANPKILIEAARYLRSTDNPFAEAMAAEVDAAAAELTGKRGLPRVLFPALSEHAKGRARGPGGVFLPAAVDAAAAPEQAPEPKPAAPGAPAAIAISDENVKILLRAGGFKVVKRTTLVVYRTMLSRPDHAWTPEEVGRNAGVPRATANHTMHELMRRKIIERIAVGHYRAS